MHIFSKQSPPQCHSYSVLWIVGGTARVKQIGLILDTLLFAVLLCLLRTSNSIHEKWNKTRTSIMDTLWGLIHKHSLLALFYYIATMLPKSVFVFNNRSWSTFAYENHKQLIVIWSSAYFCLGKASWDLGTKPQNIKFFVPLKWFPLYSWPGTWKYGCTPQECNAAFIKQCKIAEMVKGTQKTVKSQWEAGNRGPVGWWNYPS